MNILSGMVTLGTPVVRVDNYKFIAGSDQSNWRLARSGTLLYRTYKSSISPVNLKYPE